MSAPPSSLIVRQPSTRKRGRWAWAVVELVDRPRPTHAGRAGREVAPDGLLGLDGASYRVTASGYARSSDRAWRKAFRVAKRIGERRTAEAQALAAALAGREINLTPPVMDR